MRIIDWEKLSAAKKITTLHRPTMKNRAELMQATKKIIKRVRAQGDTALRNLTKRYDGVSLNGFQVTSKEFTLATRSISKSAKQAINRAFRQIKIFHQAQYPKNIKVKTARGIVCEKQSRPIPKVGLYIPGGTAPLISTVLMLGIPAQIAQCPLKILCTPPQKDGSINPHILYAAQLCGIETIYKIGGAQAIAAMAYGTQTIPKVSKIFGPGNAWVTQAKTLVAEDPEGAAYDLPAGPSELMVIADDSAEPAFVAADLLSQAEHGVDSQVVLLAISANFIKKVQAQLQIQLRDLPRKQIATQALKNSCLINVKNLSTAIQIANQYAPEHLILQTDSAAKFMPKVTSAGSVFIGQWSPESAGDYASGTNHVLPTYGFAAAHSGLSVSDFMTQITFQTLSKQGLKSIASTIETLAELEGLVAHKRAVSIRFGGKSRE